MPEQSRKPLPLPPSLHCVQMPARTSRSHGQQLSRPTDGTPFYIPLGQMNKGADVHTPLPQKGYIIPLIEYREAKGYEQRVCTSKDKSPSVCFFMSRGFGHVRRSFEDSPFGRS